MRKLVVFISFALAVAACGGDGQSAASTAAPANPAERSESAPATTSTTTAPPDEGNSNETAPPTESTEATGPSYDGPAAPDFELALNDGSTFRLTDEQKPVYIVFWAEW